MAYMVCFRVQSWFFILYAWLFQVGWNPLYSIVYVLSAHITFVFKIKLRSKLIDATCRYRAKKSLCYKGILHVATYKCTCIPQKWSTCFAWVIFWHGCVHTYRGMQCFNNYNDVVSYKCQLLRGVLMLRNYHYHDGVAINSTHKSKLKLYLFQHQ